MCAKDVEAPAAAADDDDACRVAQAVLNQDAVDDLVEGGRFRLGEAAMSCAEVDHAFTENGV